MEEKQEEKTEEKTEPRIPPVEEQIEAIKKQKEGMGPSIVDQAKEQADRLEKANQKTEELLQRQESLHAEQMLGGHADAGQEPEKPKEMSDKEYAEKVMAGEVPEVPK